MANLKRSSRTLILRDCHLSLMVKIAENGSSIRLHYSCAENIKQEATSAMFGNLSTEIRNIQHQNREDPDIQGALSVTVWFFFNKSEVSNCCVTATLYCLLRTNTHA